MTNQKKNVSSNTVRTSVTMRIEDYRELERIAKDKKVSVAWLVRDAIEQYLANRIPLFR